MLLLPVYLLSLLIPSSHSIKLFLSTGSIEGTTLSATYSPFGNHTARVFLGIPYASPPIGQLRFKKPRGMRFWQGVMETKEYKPACMSNVTRTYKGNKTGEVSEDCLYLNVFTNDYCLKNKNCAVMIAIHGGQFLYESASAFDPQILINNFVGQGRNIIVVSVNYRLGIFGFGQFHGDSGSSGDRNLGLWDCLAAIKWVRKEIGVFCGDKNRITLTGHSAGAALTFLISASPHSKGLYHQQILMSQPFPNYSKQTNYKGTTAAAIHLGCLEKGTGFEELSKEVIDKAYQCLRTISGEQLLNAQLYVIANTTYFFGFPFVDGDFITDYPDQLFDKKLITPITTMLGTTSAELRQTAYINNYPTDKAYLLKNLCEIIGYEVYSDPKTFSQKCYAYYKNGTDSQFLSDDYEFYSGAVNVANSHVSDKTKVFLYSYDYAGAGAAFAKYMPTVPSPHHSEDLASDKIYIFGTHRNVMAPKDYVVEHLYSGLYANFINFGNPSPSENQKWTPYSKEKREYFLIDFDGNFTMPGMREGYYKRTVDFWINSGFKKHHKETWATSLDTQVITNLVNPITTHLTGRTNYLTDDKSFENNEKLYEEREKFLEDLKNQKIEGRKILRTGQFEANEDGGINILLLIFAGTLIIGILYLLITHCWIHRSREGYQLLKGTDL